jgi:hypothetical protein
MSQTAKKAILLLVAGPHLVRSAIHPNGTHVSEPLTGNDPSPIDDINTYYPDQHDCPPRCADYTNVHGWITYFSVDRLHRCHEPMLLQFSISQPLDDQASSALIRACALGPDVDARPFSVPPVPNPKRTEQLFQGGLESAPACASNGTRATDEVQLAKSAENARGNSSDSAELMEGMQSFFAARDNCDERFLFGYHKGTVAGAYIGAELGKLTAESASGALADHFRGNVIASNRTIAELCDDSRPSQRVFGIVVDSRGDLNAVRMTALTWSMGSCAIKKELNVIGSLPGVRVMNIASRNNTNATFSRVNRRASPQANSNGVCATHLIQNGDTCSDLAKQYSVSVDNLEEWNKGKTWAWTECKDMLIGYSMCISDGSAPMPPPQAGTQCGPLVPGTQPPKDKSVSLSDLNPCPLKACCSNWGFCGVFPAHCDVHAPAGGGPGSKEKGFQNTCVSNCGYDTKLNSGPPSKFQRIGYYESYNYERECLWMNVKDANTDGSYTHIHWAFAEIDPLTWKPVIKDKASMWDDFKLLRVKRIVSFGGWAYSTEPATYNIIRSAIIDHRDTFAANLAAFVQSEGLDGVDIDWEYPGVSDMSTFASANTLGLHNNNGSDNKP